MKEIILRNDPSAYVPKSFGSFSARQLTTFALIAVTCVPLATAGYFLHAFDFVIPPIMAIGGFITWIGMGKPGDMRAEIFLALIIREYLSPKNADFTPPRLVRVSDVSPSKTSKKRTVDLEFEPWDPEDESFTQGLLPSQRILYKKKVDIHV